ncbi:MAG: CBS domain-containing protein [Phycisphaeraceae bacterium]|nr:CBS domain-containing protein [Phycisphaerales bacterium]MCB9842420.1 CBS domain-containing protein [Phycisphaeraceae bacterium]
MPTIDHLLSRKPADRQRVVTISKNATALEAARVMNDHHIGALVVTDDDHTVAGIFTERDLLTRIVSAQRAPEKTRVADVMTTNVVVCSPETRCDDVRHIMREKRIRHIPVTEGRRLMGMISIGDLNTAEVKVLAETITYLEQFVAPS